MLNERVRGVLIRTLYSQPRVMAIGAFLGIASCTIVAAHSGLKLMWLLAALTSLVAMGRVVAACILSPDDNTKSMRQLELIFEIGAFSYAFLLGLFTAATIHLREPAELQLLMVANAICFGTAASAHNAGRPVIALGQLALAVLPFGLVALFAGTIPMIFLSMTVLMLILAMSAITLNLFRTLRNSISSAETSEQMAREMRKLARSDVVTGLLNRAGLNQDIVRQVNDLPEDRMLALFWMDLDRFKEVNDSLGHQTGDRVLLEIASRLQDCTPDSSIIARFGGDEFIICVEVSDRREAERIASEIHACTMGPMRVNDDRMQVGGSIGVALMPDDGNDADTLMQNADLALYHAKVNGRKQTRFYDAGMSRELVRRREIESELRDAITKDELSIFFQPIVDLESGRIRAFEALVRWFHPRKGELTPDEFIPIAEESGVIVTLGNWIAGRAARVAAQWPDDVKLTVNLSPTQIRAPGASLGILNALREAKLPPERLVLEVTERLFLEDHVCTEAFVEDLTKAGVRFALDDFGTGYSSLAYLQKFPIHTIKIDRSFVSGPDVGPKSDAIIHAVSELGSRLDMNIVAEGIETIEQLNAVRTAGCTLGQGFHFSRAVPDYLAAMLLADERGENQPIRARA